MRPWTSHGGRAKAHEASCFVHRLRSPLLGSAETRKTRRLWSTTKINSAKRKESKSGNCASLAGSLLDSCSPRNARVSEWIRYPYRAQSLKFPNCANWSAPVLRSCSIQRLKTKMSMDFFLLQFVKKGAHTRWFYSHIIAFRQVLQNNNLFSWNSSRSSFQTIFKNTQFLEHRIFLFKK